MVTCIFIKSSTQILKQQVLAINIESTQSPTLTPTPSSKPTLAPTIKPKPKPMPTLTPTPYLDPTPTPDVWSPPQMTNLFTQYANVYNVDQNILERLANCESHFNPDAKNGDYLGIFQFSVSLWQSYRQKLGMDANPDLRRNIEESIRTAAFVLSQRGTSPWPSCL